MTKTVNNGWHLQIQWVEEEDHIFAFVVGQRYVFELSVDDSGAFEDGRRFANLWVSGAGHGSTDSHRHRHTNRGLGSGLESTKVLSDTHLELFEL